MHRTSPFGEFVTACSLRAEGRARFDRAVILFRIIGRDCPRNSRDHPADLAVSSLFACAIYLLQCKMHYEAWPLSDDDAVLGVERELQMSTSTPNVLLPDSSTSQPQRQPANPMMMFLRIAMRASLSSSYVKHVGQHRLNAALTWPSPWDDN